VTEEVRWTKAGKAALETDYGRIHYDADAADLKKRAVAAAKASKAEWKTGLKKADHEGKRAVELANQVAQGKLPKKLSVDDGARLLSLMGTSESEHLEVLGELLIREHGLAWAVAVAARMWSHRSEYSHPKWPKKSKTDAMYITAIEDDDDHVHDASCSYSKATFTEYLHRRWRKSTAAERAEMKKGVSAIWSDVTPHARPALAYLSHDPKRAKQSAEELLHAGESPWPFWAWDHLPMMIEDVELALSLLKGGISIQCIASIGTAIWESYVDAIGGRISSDSRARLLGEFSNFYGPKTALLLAEYQDNKECAQVVRDYFTLYPELLERVIDDPELKYHRDDLQKMLDGIRADKPDQDRPRSSRTSSRSDTASSRRTSARTS